MHCNDRAAGLFPLNHNLKPLIILKILTLNAQQAAWVGHLSSIRSVCVAAAAVGVTASADDMDEADDYDDQTDVTEQQRPASAHILFAIISKANIISEIVQAIFLNQIITTTTTTTTTI